MKSVSSSGMSAGPWMSAGSAVAIRLFTSAQIFVMMPNGDRSDSADPPVDASNMPGMRDAAFSRCAAAD